ncbi:MAG: hypothetical protein IPO57_14675 [Rhodocyclales bacterium]|jgi:hypothetical protein|nr:hypothetical protein [Rhodocyclales bacterium]
MMMEEPARHMMGGMMNSPMTQGAMMAATGFAAGRGLIGGVLLRSPLLLIGAGLVAGYLVHKYEKEIVLAATKAMGMGKDFALQQKEHLSDLVAEAQEQEAQPAQTEAPPSPQA